MPLNETTQHAVLNAILAIPKGKVANYGLVATVAGIARGHRVVARFLREYQDPKPLPWHRIIKSDGRLAFDKQSKHHHIQVERLANEGVIVNNGKVDLKRYLWQPDLDLLIFGPMS
jgi:methylated-DNA-protein-cysteine methyltransferase related protein